MPGVDERITAIDVRISGLMHASAALKDDLKLILTSELKGALGNFETRLEHIIEEHTATKAA